MSWGDWIPELAGYLRIEERKLLRHACSLRKPPLTQSHDGEGDQENNDSEDTDDVRRDGDKTGNVARVRPEETDYRSHDEDSHHRS